MVLLGLRVAVSAAGQFGLGGKAPSVAPSSCWSDSMLETRGMQVLLQAPKLDLTVVEDRAGRSSRPSLYDSCLIVRTSE